MGNVLNLNEMKLEKSEMDNVIELEKAFAEVELKLASGSDVQACPFCKGNGCYGACTMSC